MATIMNTVKLYSEKGIQGIRTMNRNVNSDNARRKFDGRAEARIIEIACSPAPEGHSVAGHSVCWKNRQNCT